MQGHFSKNIFREGMLLFSYKALGNKWRAVLEIFGEDPDELISNCLFFGIDEWRWWQSGRTSRRQSFERKEKTKGFFSLDERTIFLEERMSVHMWGGKVANIYIYIYIITTFHNTKYTPISPTWSIFVDFLDDMSI